MSDKLETDSIEGCIEGWRAEGFDAMADEADAELAVMRDEIERLKAKIAALRAKVKLGNWLALAAEARCKYIEDEGLKRLVESYRKEGE